MLYEVITPNSDRQAAGAASPAPDRRKEIGRAAMKHYVKGIFEAGMLWNWPLERLYPLFDA